MIIKKIFLHPLSNSYKKINILSSLHYRIKQSIPTLIDSKDIPIFGILCCNYLTVGFKIDSL